MKPRDLALKALNKLDQGPGFPDAYLRRAFQEDPSMSERDRAFTLHLVQGVFRWRLRLDWIIQQAARFSFERIEPPVLNILRIALYQIFFMDRVPPSAAVNEAVNQAKFLDRPRSRSRIEGVVNGLLRHVCRTKNGIAFPDPEKEPLQYLSIVHSYPLWLVEKWVKELGMATTEAILAASNALPARVLRVNRLRTEPSRLIRRLAAEGVTAEPTRFSSDGLLLHDLKGPIDRLKAFQEGLFVVQGEAAQVCTTLLAPEKGECVLDLCAGLGGKSTHMAQLMTDQGRVFALDTNHGRLVSLSETGERLGITCLRPIAAHGEAHLDSLFRGSFDRILVDAPCSGLGVLSKNPDGKWARGPSDIERLSRLQKKMLIHAAPLLRRGGEMLYVTCTISREENEGVVADFLKVSKGMVCCDLKERATSRLSARARDLVDTQGFLRTLPHRHKMEGFFGALFVKKE